MMESERRATGRWKALDGLRALAAGSVVLFHADGFAPQGYIGVDVFFALSGFLITTLLMDEYARRGTVGIGRFWTRRMLRLYPALVVMVACVAVLALVTDHHPIAVSLGAVATLGYYANIWEYTAGHDTYLLQHTWTLAIEQQFYLLWPFGFLAMARSRPMRVLLPICVVASIVAIASSTSGIASTYSRGSGLALGCAAAVLLRMPTAQRALATLAAPALALLAVIVFLPDVPAIVGGWWIPFGAVATVPIIAAATGTGILQRLLAVRPLTWLGVRSYSLYLWHFPILSLAINNAPASLPLSARVIGGIVASVGAAHLSYVAVEQRGFRLRARLMTPTKVVGQ